MNRFFIQTRHLSNSGIKQIKLEKLLDKRDPKLLLQFTCSYKGDDCKTLNDKDKTSQKAISKKSYETGVVLVKCNCDKLHLIADNLGWFDDHSVNIETILKEKGQEVQRLQMDHQFEIEE